MNIIKKGFLFFIFISISFFTYSQAIPNPSRVEAIARFFQDSVVVRWSPTTPEAWVYGNQNGYRIVRYTLKKDQNNFTLTNPEKIELTLTSIKPYSLSNFESLAKKNKYAAIVAQAIYGNSFETKQSNSAIQLVNRAKELENRFSFSLFCVDQSLEIARAHGLAFTDRKVKKGESYLYHIYIPSSDQKIKIDTGFVYIDTSQPFQLPKIAEVKAEFKDQVVELSWNRLYAESYFSNYIIERSEGKNNFQALDRAPIIELNSSGNSLDRIHIIDSLPNLSVEYRYRIRGVTPFGEISEPSDEVKGKSISKITIENPVITNHQLIMDGKIKLNWEYSSSELMIKGFQIKRGLKANGPFTIISSKLIKTDQREYVDSKPNSTNYYILSAIDQTGKNHDSFPVLVQLLDSIPPQAPQEVKGWIDTLGIVRINWKSNTEKDLKMYRIFKSNHPNTTFIQINNEELKKNEFIDTFNIRLLNKKMYYKVAAVDNHYNQSLYSSVLVLAKPDLIPPASPSWKKVESSTSSIYLQWQPSQSEDVAFHQIYRKAKSDLEWKMIKQFDTKRIVNEYIDPVEKGKIYEYAIVAKDSAGLTSSFENKIKIKSIDDKILPVVTTLKAISDSKNKKIKLTWSYPISVEKIKIYRAEKGKSLSIWKIISGDQTEIDDKHVYINASYDYAIQVIDYFGSESTISKRVNVKY